MVSTEPKEFKQALLCAEQARARTLGELVLQKKRVSYPDLFSVSTPPDITKLFRSSKCQQYFCHIVFQITNVDIDANS